MALPKGSLVRLLLVAVCLGAGSTVHADVVTDWNAAALDAIRAARTPPPTASRALAILHASIYDAVNGIARLNKPYLVKSAVLSSASREAAASAAAHKVMLTLFPSASGASDALHTATLALIADGPQKTAGIVWGESVAAEMLLARASDQSDAIVSPPDDSGPGAWVPTPPAFAPYLLPQWGGVAPFVMPSTHFFRPDGPPSLDSDQYASDVNEVKGLGAKVGSTRTAEQSQIALFWADGAGTETPPGHWNSIAQVVAAQFHNTLDQNARLFALLNLAMADAAICAWEAKHWFDFWRPVTAIRQADSDDNPATTADPTWESFIVTPPFPEYVSGHSTFSAAAATVLAMFYGTDDVAFPVGSDALPGVTVAFTSFSAAALEAAASRLYGGIHFRAAIEDGLTAGVGIGEWTYTHFLKPEGNRAKK